MFKQALSVLIAFTGLSSATAQTCTSPKIAYTATLNGLGTTDLMTVPVTIDGKTKQFLLDISMKPTEVSQAAVAELALPERPKQTELFYFGDSVSGAQGRPYEGLQVPLYDVRDNAGIGALITRVNVASFTIGNATANHIQLLVSKDKDMGRSEPYDGLMTGDFFRQYDVELDSAAKKITYLTPTNCTDAEQVVYWPHTAVGIIPVTLATDGKLQVQLMAQDHIINGEIDTSSARTMMRRGIAEQLLGFRAGKEMVAQGDLTDGLGQQVYGHTFPQIIFAGGVIAANVPVLIVANSMVHENRETMLGSHAQFTDTKIPDFTIGMDVLRRLHLYVVYGQGKIYVTSAE